MDNFVVVEKPMVFYQQLSCNNESSIKKKKIKPKKFNLDDLKSLILYRTFIYDFFCAINWLN